MNYIIQVLSAICRTEVDHYETGCQLDTAREYPREHDTTYPSVVAAFQDIVGDNQITPEQIGTIDPNIYQDTRSGTTRVVVDNQAAGIYRCTYDRQENSRRRVPTATQRQEFEAGERTLLLATYEITFRVCYVGLDEQALATLLGVSNWS